MYMKKRLMVLITVFVLFISGCNLNDSSGPSQSEDIHSGTEGLDMDFVRNLPPSRIYDTASLTILAELENKGAYDLTERNCLLHLHGADPNTFIGLTKVKECGNMKGKSTEYPKGEKNSVEFGTDTINLMEGLDSLPQNFVLTACYDYETVATPVVCIDPTFYEANPIRGACTVSDVSMSGGQGAPVSVSRVGVNMLGRDRVSFEIDIKNSGGGTILRNGIDLYNTCPGPIPYSDTDIVEYDIDMRGATKIRCSPELDGGPRVRLTGNTARIVCTFSVSETTAYTTPLNINLAYSYMDSISKSVEVIKTP